MLYLNVSEVVMAQWGRTIDLYYSLHLGSIGSELKSVNLLIEEDPLYNSDQPLYRCQLTVIPLSGKILTIFLESERCGAAIERCFAKARRCLVRRMRGFSDAISATTPPLSNLANRI